MKRLVRIKTTNIQIDTYKLAISILMGLFSFAGAFFSTTISFSYFNLHFVWSQVFFILITLAWGRFYGLVSLTLGLGAFFPFFIWSNNGWSCLVALINILLWVWMIGGQTPADDKHPGSSKKLYLAQIQYSLITIIMYYLAYPLLIGLNKTITPFWEMYPIKNISNYVLVTIILITVIFNFLIMSVCDALLLIQSVRRLFKLPVDRFSRHNSKIIFFSVLLGWTLLIMITGADYLLIEKKTVKLFFSLNNERVNISMLLTSAVSIIFGGYIARYFQNHLKALEEIRQLNTDLEKKVSERTCQLQSALTELEAFNYTVSHDLKSPLRSIDAYCQFIQEDYKEVMDPEMYKMVVNIQNISKDMIEMIKKLLNFSSKNHFAITLEELDMENCINTVFEELHSSNSRKPMELVFLSPLPEVKADRVLIWEMLSNIISNSIKFAKKNEKLVIKVNCEDTDDEYIFSIRDNGIGFDMDYSSKLFGVFQRLHSQEEYEGSGIGLATVRKIIQMHSGRVWIEGKVNEGTTFYFALPKESTD